MKQCKKILVAVLAAGSSSRMKASKLTMPFANTTMLDIALRAAAECAADEAVAVIGGYRNLTSKVVDRHPSVRKAYNPLYSEGQSTSIRCAVECAIESGCDALLIMVADQPFVRAADLDLLINASEASGARAFVTESAERSGNPCLFTHSCFPALLDLEGDQGARATFPLWDEKAVEHVRSCNPLIHEDADTAEAFCALARLYEEGAATAE